MTDRADDFVGDKYTGQQDTTELARLIRRDLAAARDAGEFPAAVSFGVAPGDGRVTVHVYGITVDAETAAKISVAGNAYNRITRPAYGEREAFYELRIEGAESGL